MKILVICEKDRLVNVFLPTLKKNLPDHEFHGRTHLRLGNLEFVPVGEFDLLLVNLGRLKQPRDVIGNDEPFLAHIGKKPIIIFSGGYNNTPRFGAGILHISHDLLLSSQFAKFLASPAGFRWREIDCKIEKIAR